MQSQRRCTLTFGLVASPYLRHQERQGEGAKKTSLNVTVATAQGLADLARQAGKLLQSPGHYTSDVSTKDLLEALSRGIIALHAAPVVAGLKFHANPAKHARRDPARHAGRKIHKAKPAKPAKRARPRKATGRRK